MAKDEKKAPDEKPEKGGGKPEGKGGDAKAEGKPKPDKGGKPEGKGEGKPMGEGGGKGTAPAAPAKPLSPARLRKQYADKILPELMTKFGRKNRHSIPRLEKIVVNMGVGKAIEDKTRLEKAQADLTQIAGQKAVTTLAKTSISTFRLREGYPIGCMVTLRGRRMYEFLDRLINIALPRIRDFRGVNPKSFDGRGNFNLGLTEQVVFPEIDADKVTATQGMDIAIVTSATSDDEGRELLKAFGMPFRTD